ncbi:tissue factor pathway inhibitor-like [Ixodes scapularis]
MGNLINSLLLVTTIITLQGVVSSSSKTNAYKPIEYDDDDSEESTTPLKQTGPTTITPSETVPAPPQNNTGTKENPQNKLGGTEVPTTTTTQVVPATRAPEPKYTAAYVPDAPRRPKVCMLEEDEGDCDGEGQGPGETRVFFNAKTNSCDYFPYSGCKGNGNNFATEEECMERCREAPTTTTAKGVPATPAPEPTYTAAYVPDAPRLPKICMLEEDIGECDSGEEGNDELRVFFNAQTNTCEHFPYSGCKGNANNFADEEECLQRCRSECWRYFHSLLMETGRQACK